MIGSGIAALLEKDGIEELTYMGRKWPTEYDVEVDASIGPDCIDITDWRKYDEAKAKRNAKPLR